MKAKLIQRDKIMSKLHNRAFHVTSKAGFEGIVSTGSILCQQEGLELPNRYDAQAYGRNRGYVSFVNLRSLDDETVVAGRDRYYFLNPPNVLNEPHFLVMSEKFADTLLPWTQAKDAGREMWVPYIESYAPSPVDIEHVVECYYVTIQPSEWEKRLERRSD